MKKIKNLIMEIYLKYITWRIKRKLIKRYTWQNTTNRLMEKFITKRITDGQTGRRQELVQKRQEIKETDILIDFLKK